MRPFFLFFFCGILQSSLCKKAKRQIYRIKHKQRKNQRNWGFWQYYITKVLQDSERGQKHTKKRLFSHHKKAIKIAFIFHTPTITGNSEKPWQNSELSRTHI